MINLYRKFNAAYGQYFTFQGPYRKHTLALLGIICLNIAVLLILPQYNVALAAIYDVFMTSGLTYGMFFSAVKDFCIALVQYVFLQMASWRLVEWLGQSLAYHKQQEVLKKYYQPAIPYVVQALGQTKEPKDKVEFAHAQVCDAPKAATRFSTLFNDFMSTFPQGGFNLYILWKNSPALTGSLFGRMFVIPRYMVVFAILYAAVYNVLLHWLSKPLVAARAAAMKYEAHLKNETHDGTQHAENISLLSATSIHLQRALKVLHEKYNATQGFANKAFIVQFFITINSISTMALAMCIVAPALIAKQISNSLGMTLVYSFQLTVTMFSWFYNSAPEFSKLGPSLEILSQYDHAILEAEKLVEEKHKNVTYHAENKKEILFSRVTVEIPTVKKNTVSTDCSQGCNHHHHALLSDDLPQVDAKNLKTHQVIEGKSIAIGSRIKITGASGGGKTTLQRITAGIWPFGNDVSIKIPFAREEVMYLPQKATFPLKTTLWEAICYPCAPRELTPGLKQQVENWMRALRFDQKKHIDCLEQEAEWPTLLSGGEGQRIRMLSVLVNQPKLVFMDESLSGLDVKSYSAISKLLNTDPVLKNTTFICIVHGHQAEPGEEDFYNTNFKEWKMEALGAAVDSSSQKLKIA